MLNVVSHFCTDNDHMPVSAASIRSISHILPSVLSQEIGLEERLRNDLFCVEWDVKF